MLASRTRVRLCRRGRRARGQSIGTRLREPLEALAVHPVRTTACLPPGKRGANSRTRRGVRRVRSAKELQHVMRLPARVRTWGKRGHGLLEDRVVVLGRFEVDDVLCGIDEVTEQRQLFREPPAVGRLVDPLERLGEERIETRRDSIICAGRGASLELVAAGVAVDYTEPAWTSSFNARPPSTRC